MGWRHSDDVPVSKETRESQITRRQEVVREARQSGDATFEARATERLDRALDNYSRENRSA